MSRPGSAHSADGSWHGVLDRHAVPLFRLAFRLTGESGAAEDLTLRTFGRFRDAAAAEGSADPGEQLRNIAVRLYLSGAETEAGEHRPRVPPPGATAPEQALHGLPPLLRTVAALHDMERAPLTETAGLLRVDEATLYRLVHNARHCVHLHLRAVGRPPETADGCRV